MDDHPYGLRSSAPMSDAALPIHPSLYFNAEVANAASAISCRRSKSASLSSCSMQPIAFTNAFTTPSYVWRRVATTPA